MSFVSQAFIIGGVALDLVGAAVLSHAHNAESALELREEIGGVRRPAAAVGQRRRTPYRLEWLHQPPASLASIRAWNLAWFAACIQSACMDSGGPLLRARLSASDVANFTV